MSKTKTNNKNTYVFIDAANLFYGGEKSLGWKIDYDRLFKYLVDKYSAKRIFYFGAIETLNFEHDYINKNSVDLEALEEYLSQLLKPDDFGYIQETENEHVLKNLQRVKFYRRLESFGYELFLKPIKTFKNIDGSTTRKSNSDIDMAIKVIEEKDAFNTAVVLSGDGDFIAVLKYLKKNGKKVLVLSRSKRTAREIKYFAGENFRDFDYLETKIGLLS